MTPGIAPDIGASRDAADDARTLWAVVAPPSEREDDGVVCDAEPAAQLTNLLHLARLVEA
mgnify:CR=1 FL=1